jgi:hypothetical protein
MQELHQENGIPCQFEKALENQCMEKSDNGWCEEHKNLVCINCGKKAVRECRFTDQGHHISGGFFRCRAALCNDCQHEPYVPGKILFPNHTSHLTKKQARAMLDQALSLEDQWKDRNTKDEEAPEADS